MYPSSGSMYRSWLILWLQLGILRLCVVRTWQLFYRVCNSCFGTPCWWWCVIPSWVRVWKNLKCFKTECWSKECSVKISSNIQCTSQINKVKMKVMHGVNMDKSEMFSWSSILTVEILSQFRRHPETQLYPNDAKLANMKTQVWIICRKVCSIYTSHSIILRFSHSQSIFRRLVISIINQAVL
jgi:hypothetical protein